MAMNLKAYAKQLNNPGVSHKNHPGPKHGELWTADSLPFSDGINRKSRPVLVIGRRGNELLCYKCTSQHSDYRKRYELQDLIEAGLCVPTFLDYEVLHIPCNKLIHRMGHISEADAEGFGAL